MSFEQPNSTVITFVDADGYEFPVNIPDARDERDALGRAARIAAARLADTSWRPHGTLELDGIAVGPAQPPAANPALAEQAASRADTIVHVWGAIADLEAAACRMPRGPERTLVDRARELASEAFRFCLQNLADIRSQLAADAEPS
jgi:hypothetical protein